MNTTTLSPEAHRAVTALATARKMVAEAKKIEDAAKVVLNAELTEANATHGTDENGTVLVERVTATNGSFNRADLKTLFPEAFAATYRETEYTKLVIK